MITQANQILSYMRENRSTGITPYEALDLFGCMRLAARIKDLRAAGVRIDTEDCTKISKYGRKVRYARYRLSEDQK